MKEVKNLKRLIFILAVILLVIKPVILFSSNTLQIALNCTTALGLKNIIKKRKETVRFGNLIEEENVAIRVTNPFLPFLLYSLKKWLFKLILALSALLSSLILLIRNKGTVFHITPAEDYCVALSVIRI